MSQQYIGVSELLLRKPEYVKNYQHVLRRYIIFDEFLDYLLQVYGSYRILSNVLHDQQQPDDQKPSIFRSFRIVLQSIVKQFTEVTYFQETEIGKLKNKKHEELVTSFESIVRQIQAFEPQQKAYKIDLKKIADKSEIIRREAIIVKDKKSQLLNYYSEDFTYNKYTALNEQLNEINRQFIMTKQKGEQLHGQQSSFLSQLYNFRKTLVNSRYLVLDRFKNMCSDAKSGLVTLFIILFENIRRGKAIFKKQSGQNEWNSLRNSRMRYQRSRTDLEKITSNTTNHTRNTDMFVADINKITNEYNRKLNDLIRLVALFTDSFANMAMNFKLITDKHKRILIQNAGSTFEVAQSPVPLIKSVCQVFEVCTNKLAQIGTKLKQNQNQLMNLSQKLKMHIEISISLLKTSSPELQHTSISHISHRRGEDTTSSNINGQIAYHTTQLEKQINSSQLEGICKRILDIIEDKLAGIVQWLESITPKRRRLPFENSMEVSMLTEYDEVMFQREATRDEMWLYMEWRDPSYKVLSGIQQAKVALQQIKSVPPPIDNAQELQSYTCTLDNKSLKGTLVVRTKDVMFSSQNGQFHIKVPFSDVESVSSKSKFLIGDFLNIVTSKGDLVFSSMGGNAGKCKDKILEQQNGTGGTGEGGQAGDAAAPVQQTRRKKVILDAAQLAFIQTRKQKIKSQLIDLKKLTSINSTEIYTGIDIDDFYDILYSDTPKIIKGKKWDAPMVFLLQQTGNHKVKATPYKNPGPKFYTGSETVTFMNCPVYSEREIEYDHDIPKLGIPFMPKFVHIKHFERLYWVSHEEFHFYLKSHSSGAPYASSFFAMMMVIVKKKGADIEAQYLGGIQFLEQPAFKKMLKQKGESEMKEGLTKNVKLYRERVEAFRNSGGKEEQKIQVVEQHGQNAASDDKKSMSKEELIVQLQSVKKQKNIVLIASAVVLLISILMKLF